jgi:Protein of unknown function (DUF2634)
MIPSGASTQPVELVNQPSLTYAFDSETKRIQGKIDGLAAVMQSVKKTLETERFAYVIYDDQYGVEMEGLYGKPEDFVKSVLLNRLQDAFLGDARILGFDGFSVSEIAKDKVTFHVNVNTTHGAFRI